jgi:hypothetical protein
VEDREAAIGFDAVGNSELERANQVVTLDTAA